MAPKRQAGTSGSDAKKHKRTPVEENLEILAEGFDNTDYEFPCRESLKPLIKTVLCVPVEKRHEFQEKVFGMVEDALLDAKNSLEARRGELQAEVDNGDKVEQDLVDELATTNAELAKVEAEIEVAEVCVKEATIRLRDGKNMLDTELKALVTERVDFDAHTADYEELNTKFVELFLDGAMKTFIDDRSHRNALEKLVNKFIATDAPKASILESSYAALYKEPETRTKFDTHALDLFEDLIEDKLSAIQKLIASTKPDFSKRDGLQEEVEKLTLARDEEQAKLDALRTTNKELVASVKNIEKRMKRHPQTMKELHNALTAVVDTLACFNRTVVPANRFLQDYTEVVEELERTEIEGTMEQEHASSGETVEQSPRKMEETAFSESILEDAAPMREQTPRRTVEMAQPTPVQTPHRMDVDVARATPVQTPRRMDVDVDMARPITPAQTPQRMDVDMVEERTPRQEMPAASMCSGTPYEDAVESTPFQEPLENVPTNFSPREAMKPTPWSQEQSESRAHTPSQF